MDGFRNSSAPKAYQEIQWIPNTFVVFMGLGWSINYIGMVWHSFYYHTYSMAIIPLCSNIAWEIVYTLIYPPQSLLEQLVFSTGLLINIAVIYAAVKFSPREWDHAPLVQEHLSCIFAVGILASLAGHLALVAEIGASLAYSWGAVICQILLSVGGLGQLLARGSTRGGSYTLWLGRYLGSCCTVVFAIYRYWYWTDAFSWLMSPLLLWSLAVFLVADAAYGFCFHYIRQQEIGAEKSKCN